MQNVRITTSAIILGLATALISFASVASAQYAGPYAQVVISTQTASGGSIGSVDVTMNAPGVGFSGSPVFGTDSASFFSSFNNDTHLATFNGGSYTILATQVSGYSYSYSPGCSGFTPAGGTAQCTITAYPIGGGGYFGGNGTLIVYTNTTNLNNSYNNNPLQNFIISVTGNNPSPATFQGTSAGTVVSLGAGNYSVSPATVGGFTPAQSMGCTGIMQNGQTQYCTVTYSFQGGYPYNPYNPYYPYTNNLTCTPSSQQVSIGGAANFTAQGGNGTYSWNTGERTYLNAGQTLSTTFGNSGTHLVTVTSGTLTATCSVYVLYPAGTVSGQPANGIGYTYPTYPTTVSKGYPVLPNTGFAPQDGAAFAFALVALLAAGILSAPYVRRTAQSILG